MADGGAGGGGLAGRGRIGLNGFRLKLIAIATMLIDHIGAGLYPSVLWLRVVGRIAFPVFAFFIAEGYFHTRNVKRYAVRLGVFAIVSELPFNLLHGGNLFDPGAQNIFFTLFIGLATLYGLDKIKNAGASGKHGAYAPLIKRLSVILAGMAAAELLRADYGMFGVALIVIFYLFRDNRAFSMQMLVAANVFYGLVNMLQSYAPLQAFAGFAAAPLYFYNGKKGPSMKYFFYVFYPLHISLIVAFKHFIMD